MLYTVRNFGVPVGTTDLGFPVVMPDHRIGEFHPNAEGERILPIVTEAYAAVHADLKARRLTPSDRARAALDAAERELGLTLHLPDGTELPVSLISIRDMEQVVTLNALTEAEEEALFADISPEEQEAIDREVAELIAEWEAEHAREPWEPEPEPRPVARYQLHVTLEEGAYVP